MDLKWLLFSFEGRVNRLPYWGVALVMIALGTGFNIAIGDFGPERPMTAGPAIFETAVFLFFMWIGLAVQIKRWHDRNKSAWWALLNLVPVIGTIWVLIECGFLPGTAGPNRYGPPPPGTADVSARPPSGQGMT